MVEAAGGRGKHETQTGSDQRQEWIVDKSNMSADILFGHIEYWKRSSLQYNNALKTFV